MTNHAKLKVVWFSLHFH